MYIKNDSPSLMRLRVFFTDDMQIFFESPENMNKNYFRFEDGKYWINKSLDILKIKHCNHCKTI